MGYTLRKYDFDAPHAGGGGRKPKYPWDVWLDGRIIRLRRGHDFQPKINSFRSAVNSMAQKRKIKVRTRAEYKNGNEYLVIQAMTSKPKRDRRAA